MKDTDSMAKANSVHSTPPTNTPIAEVAHGLFELETSLLRVRDLAYAVVMAAGSSELSQAATNALEAIGYTIVDELNEIIEERTRLCNLAASEGGSHG
jgi:hypothetical protein